MLALTMLAAISTPAQDPAILTAAGFRLRGAEWHSDCDDPGTASYVPGTVEAVRDLNGDGLPEAIVTEGGAFCYGGTGTAFWLVGKQPDGSWKLLFNQVGIPDFLPQRAMGWPDLSIGGPGFCFPVYRWNGSTYVDHRLEYEGKPCQL